MKKFASDTEEQHNKLKKEFSNSDRTISELKNQISVYCDNLNQKASEKKQLSAFIDKLQDKERTLNIKIESLQRQIENMGLELDGAEERVINAKKRA